MSCKPTPTDSSMLSGASVASNATKQAATIGMHHPAIYPHRLANGRSWLAPELAQLELNSACGQRLQRRRLATYRWALQSGRLAYLGPEDGWEMLEAMERRKRLREYYHRKKELREEMRRIPAGTVGVVSSLRSVRKPRRSTTSAEA